MNAIADEDEGEIDGVEGGGSEVGIWWLFVEIDLQLGAFYMVFDPQGSICGRWT
jgi:hypothetical protein